MGLKRIAVIMSFVLLVAFSAYGEVERLSSDVERQSRKQFSAEVDKAISNLDLIINNIDGATTAQVKAAIKILAKHQKAIIKRMTK